VTGYVSAVIKIHIVGSNGLLIVAHVGSSHNIYLCFISAYLMLFAILLSCLFFFDRLCGLVARVLGYRSGGPGSIPGTTRKKVVGLERGPLSLVSTTEELFDRKVAAPV
jgi:hypothetical protein